MYRQIFTRSPAIFRSSTIQQFLIVGFAGLIIVFFNLITVLFLARQLDTKTYGQLLYFLNWFGVLRLLMGLGLGSRISKDIAEAGTNYELLNRRFWTLLVLRLGTMTLLSSLTIGIGMGFNLTEILYAAIAAGCAVISDFIIASFGGLQRVSMLNIVSLIQPISYLLAILTQLTFHKTITIHDVLLLYIITQALTTITAIIMIARSPIMFPKPHMVDRAYLRGTFGFLGLVYLLTLLMYAYGIIITMGLGFQQRFVDLAMFGRPLSLVLMPLSIGSPAIVATFYPTVCRLLANQQRQQAVQIFENFLRWLVLGSAWIGILLMIFPEFVLVSIYSTRYSTSAGILVILSPLVTLTFIETLLVFMYVALNLPGYAIIGHLIQLLVLCSGSWLASAGHPEHLALNLAWSYLLATLLGALVLWLPLARVLAYNLRPRNLLRGSGSLATATCVAMIFQSSPPMTIAGKLALMACATLVYLCILYWSGSLDPKRPWIEPAIITTERTL